MILTLPPPSLRVTRVWRPAQPWHRALVLTLLLQTRSHGAGVRAIRNAAERLARDGARDVSFDALMPWGFAVQEHLHALPVEDRLPVLVGALRELLTDAPDAALPLDRAVRDALHGYGATVTDAHHATALRILDAAQKDTAR